MIIQDLSAGRALWQLQTYAFNCSLSLPRRKPLRLHMVKPRLLDFPPHTWSSCECHSTGTWARWPQTHAICWQFLRAVPSSHTLSPPFLSSSPLALEPKSPAFLPGLCSLQSIYEAATMIFLKLRSDHVTPLLKSLTCGITAELCEALPDSSLIHSPSPGGSLCACYTGLLAASRTCQACSCLRALAFAVSSAWNVLP